MASNAYNAWLANRKSELDEIHRAHAAIGGLKRGRRYATQQVNNAYAVLLASQFQGFCRDLHSECVDHLISVLNPDSLRGVVRAALTRNRQLDRGNVQPASLGSDFGALEIDLWSELGKYSALAGSWKRELELLNNWRNAIAHQDFPPKDPGGIINVGLQNVKRWRRCCNRLARAMDALLGAHLHDITGTAPW